MTGIYIALGTNIEPRETYLKEALQLLQHHSAITVAEQSSIYETAPVGYTDQAYFLNMAVKIETSLEPVQLLEACQAIENELGRKRTIRFGPRTIDVDIILYHDLTVHTDRLTIPHPRMHERAFVLVPLTELSPDIYVPGFEQRVSGLLGKCPESDIKDVVQWRRNSSEDA
ncbi:2-amino-4-hydroxy-6-hydroxymethyldihydropteridine diphosphokinase [Lentibacillus sp. JNUCC-1]|uniref:2-amino-4-hydroxy-6- hydroxymethyldihydropteridine diphosphokinase n=1 Tax=Lentibacillus sp. JNUCC-1 TaxID=2654513 RepID=UPI0012E79586|nr:2-amino-4-hydroxy-6-hydroxymethyldihydropteridine diphosphokinase [Lentibacillus sp. JNUCC-1]MUV38049.1 2-amino-4-hydroxy-6-hydroxymethyldihydropteridine diphosphokinase [Lentibacillus sp. JNUCC-1]